MESIDGRLGDVSLVGSGKKLNENEITLRTHK